MNNNDTIHGFINFEGSIKNSDHCAFSSTLSHPESNVQNYKPGEIKAFRFIDSKFFTSREILVNNQPQTVFLEWLIQGRASIFAYSPSIIGVRYFLLLEDGTLVELIHSNNRHEYKNILMFYFKDCPSLIPKIESADFTSKSLINIAEDYHNRTCDAWDCILFEDKDRKLKLSIGVSGNYLSSQLLINSGRPEAIFRANTMGYGLAIEVENLPLLSPKFSAKMSVMVQSALFRYDTTTLTSAYPDRLSELIGRDDRLFEIKYIRLPVQMTYKISWRKINPYICFGSAANFRYSYERYNQWLIDYALEGSHFVYNSIKLVLLGINSGAGLDFEIHPRLSINIGYDLEYGFRFFSSSANERTITQNQSVYFTTSYKF